MSYYGTSIVPRISFKSEQTDNSNIITRPIDRVQGVLNDAVDVFVPQTDDEDRKNTRKKAVYAVSSVFVLSVLAALLNPKFSGKAIDKVKEWASRSEAKMKTSRSPFVRKFYAVSNEFFKFSGGLFQFANNTKAMKDKGVKWLCKSKKYEQMDDGIFKKFLQKCDSVFTGVMSKVHNGITNGFDKISKKTVFWQYKGVDKKLNSLEETFKIYKSKLPAGKQSEFEEKLKQIADARNFFAKDNVSKRLAEQEVSMSHLQADFDKKMNEYFKGFDWPTSKKNIKRDWKQFTENLSFWAEDILMPTRNKFEKQGTDAVNALIGNGKNTSGKYHELLDILAPHISQEEKSLLTKKIEAAGTKLKNANLGECKEYFDKKRDLVLGGAPTDILTAAGTLGIGAVAVSAADSKQDKMSRAVKFVAPAIVGFGVHLTLTAMLVSGVKSLLIGLAASGLTTIAGSWIKKHLIYKPTANNNAQEIKNENTNNTAIDKEAKID